MHPHRRFSRAALAAVASLLIVAAMLGLTASPAAAEPGTGTIVSCIDGGLLVFFTNDGEADTHFTLEVDEVLVDEFDLEPGGEVSRVVPMEEDTSARIVVSADGEVVDDAVHTYDCDDGVTEPKATIANQCTAASPAVVLENPTAEPVTFTVIVGTETTDHEVDPNSATRVPAELGEDASVDITVIRGGVTVAHELVTRDCERTSATIVDDCRSPGAALEIVNEGVSTSIEITAGGDSVAVLPLDADSVTTAVVPLAEDTSTRITVIDAHGGTVAEATIARDCNEVLGVAFGPPTSQDELPRTGENTFGLVALGSMLIALGSVCLTLSGLTSGVVLRRSR
jgi:hypothetical protein